MQTGVRSCDWGFHDSRVVWPWALAVVFMVSGVTQAQQTLRERLDDQHARGSDLWIYNDLESAMAMARRTNQPLFVTFRCVPCKSCEAFDAEVAKGSEIVEELGRKHFICVRQVEMKGVDLSQFEFDYDLNWAAMFLNADGTVYARYGTQSADGPDAYNSIEGLATTMQRVLQLHANYPSNADELKGKRGEKKPYETALEMPGLLNKERYRNTTMRNNCIHCHNIHDAQYEHAYQTKTLTHDMLWRYPLPENLGLTVDAKDGRSITAVVAGSPAERAGLKVGQQLTHVNGQVIASIADIQWVLDKLPNTGVTITVHTENGDGVALQTEPGWKRTDISWRGSMWSLRPRFHVWTPELTAEQKRERGLDPDQEAHEVRWINVDAPGGRAARDAGLREGDVIIKLEGKPLDMSTRHFNVHLKLNYKVGEELPLTVLRDGKPMDIAIPLVD